MLALLAVLLTQIDKMLLLRLLPLGQFGVYALASTVTGAIYLIVGPVTQAVYPALVRLVSRHDDHHLRQTYHQASQVVTLMLTAPVAVLAAFPTAVMFVWSNDAHLAMGTAMILAALAVGTYLNGLMHVPHQLQLAYQWTSLSIRSNLLAIAILMPALFWGVPRYGAIAAAIIWIVLNLAYLVIQLPIMHRRCLPGELREWYLHDVALPILGAAAVVVPARLIRPDGLGDRFAWLVFLIAVAAVAFAGSLLLTRTIRQRLFAALRTVRQARMQGRRFERQ